MPTQKPHKWNRRKDAQRCIACDVEFKTGDMVYDDCAMTMHVGCVKLYHEQLFELGLGPAPASLPRTGPK